MEGSKRKRPLIYEAPQSKIPRLSAACPCVHSARSAVHNYGNFIKSGPPRRMMFFNDGEWCDFPTDVVVNLIGAFRVRTSAMEISMCGQIFLVDFMHMFMINLKTWAQRSVAWIDESGKCFFPLIFLDSDDALTSRNKIEVDVNFQISETDSSEPRECKKIPDSPVDELEVCSGVKEEVQENDVWVSNSFGFEGLDGKLVQLEKSGNDYITVHNLFLRGLGTFATQNNVIGIYRYAPTGCAALARLQSFEKQMEITKSSRGDANVRQGWYGSSKEGIVRILLHGFGKTGKLSDRMYFSTGVCLAPEDCAHVSASFCDVDENGVQHMLLCRIIMGSMEQVQPGCEQFCPSCEDFDTGVDDLQNPRHYVIWSTQMDTHIHPEYLVSFKLTPSDRACLADLAPSDVDKRNTDVASAEDRQAISTTNPVKNGQNSVPVLGTVKLPTSIWMPFSMLFAAVQKNISPLAKDSLDFHYDAFKGKKLTREEFIKKLRLIVGDELLRSTLMQFKCNPAFNRQFVDQMHMRKGSLG